MPIKLLCALALTLTACSSGSPGETGPGGAAASPRETPTVVVGTQKLVFASDHQAQSGLDVYTTRVGSTRIERLVGVDGRDDFSPSVSPDGRSVAYRRNPRRGDEGDIFVVSMDDGRTRNLTDSPGVADWSPAWSPDGSSIAFASDREGSVDLWSMTPEGSDPVQLTDDPAIEEYPTWSPEGDRIAFQSTMEGEFDVFVMDPEGGGVTNISSHPASDKWAAWSSHGDWIAFVSTREGSEDIFVMRPDGSSVRNVTPTGDFFEGHPTWLPDGTLTYSRHGETGPISLWAIDLVGGSPVRMETEAQPVFVYDWVP